ncbi:hypothetical protein ACIQNG_20240 [Streptomyces sp. NPDC091377]|uniref:hypothetical protein n=1 Tax=Streptomyces sp. NPDC091377 TaxID=3365995 RepID=UPI0037FDD947
MPTAPEARERRIGEVWAQWDDGRDPHGFLVLPEGNTLNRGAPGATEEACGLFARHPGGHSFEFADPVREAFERSPQYRQAMVPWMRGRAVRSRIPRTMPRARSTPRRSGHRPRERPSARQAARPRAEGAPTARPPRIHPVPPAGRAALPTPADPSTHAKGGRDPNMDTPHSPPPGPAEKTDQLSTAFTALRAAETAPSTVRDPLEATQQTQPQQRRAHCSRTGRHSAHDPRRP